MESDSVEAIKSFAAVGLGNAFLPTSSVQAEMKNKTLRSMRIQGAPRLERATFVIHRRDRFLSRPHIAFREML
jgi:DNA-binding transcriptional LysR family regulator